MGKPTVEKNHAVSSEKQSSANIAETLLEARQGAPMAVNEGEQENIGESVTPPTETQGAPPDTLLNQSGEYIMHMAADMLSARTTFPTEESEKEPESEYEPELESGGPLVLVGAASFLSHGCRFKKGVSETITDDNLYNALLRTGMFKKG